MLQCGMVGHLTFQCRNYLDAAAPKPPAPSSVRSSIPFWNVNTT